MSPHSSFVFCCINYFPTTLVLASFSRPSGNVSCLCSACIPPHLMSFFPVLSHHSPHSDPCLLFLLLCTAWVALFTVVSILSSSWGCVRHCAIQCAMQCALQFDMHCALQCDMQCAVQCDMHCAVQCGMPIQAAGLLGGTETHYFLENIGTTATFDKSVRSVNSVTHN